MVTRHLDAVVRSARYYFVQQHCSSETVRASIFHVFLPVKFRCCHGCRDGNPLLLQEVVAQNEAESTTGVPVTNHMR
jgi:hypothetical protein